MQDIVRLALIYTNSLSLTDSLILLDNACLVKVGNPVDQISKLQIKTENSKLNPKIYAILTQQ